MSESKRRETRLSPSGIRRRFARLARELGRTGWILQGSICARQITRPGGEAAAGKRYGPYYQWTFKEAGTTVTVNLSAAQQREFQQAISRQRKLEKLLAEMRTLSRDYLERTTTGVVRRKPKD
jgi:hypothetical protein